MIPFLGFIPAKFQLTALVSAIALVACVGAYGGGYVIGQRDHADKVAEQNKTDGRKQVTDVVKAVELEKEKRVEVKVRDLERERQLAADLAMARDQRDSLLEVLREKPDLDPNVYVRRGDVKLLNDAAAGVDAKAGVSDPARLAAYKEQTASDVTLRGLVGTEVDIRFQYNELAKTHDTLVEWVERELIQSQLPK